MLISFFAGWLLDRDIIRQQLTNQGSFKVYTYKAIIFSLKFIAPTGILLVFLSSLNLI
jgi:NSS family neurotransmitter:Na+ symporter